MNIDEVMEAIQSLLEQDHVLRLANGVLLATVDDLRQQLDARPAPRKNPRLKGTPISETGQAVVALEIGESYFLPGLDASKRLQNRSQTQKRLLGRSYAVRPAVVDGVAGARIFRLADLVTFEESA